MARLTIALLLFTFTWNAVAAPTFHKRIAQTISASTQKWESACLAAGGADKCNPLSIKAFSTLLAAAGPCEQQDAADEMVDLAKTLKNDSNMIKLAQIFVQQPRNSPNSVAIPYCQVAPKNAELAGLYQCQFQGSDQATFAGGSKVGANGTMPFGQSSPISPAGSCPVHPSGPIADGTQLVDQVNGSANVSSTARTATISASFGASSSSSSSASSRTTSATASSITHSRSKDGNHCGNTVSSSSAVSSDTSAATSAAASSATVTSAIASTINSVAVTTPASATTSASVSASTSASSTAGSDSDFHLKNGQDAQALNAKFAALTADSPCNAGDQVCANGGFGQCVSGKLVVTQCAGGTSCFALPLVNKPGTSIACTTQDDATARIQATGAEGGITGKSA